MGYVESDYGCDLLKDRSQTCYIFTLIGCAISYKSMLQDIVAFSTTESEYRSMKKEIKEEIWLHSIIKSLGLKLEKPVLHCGCQSVLNLAKNAMYHKKTKQIDVRLNFICDILETYKFSILKIDTKVYPTNMLIKAFPTVKFKLFLDLVGVGRS